MREQGVKREILEELEEIFQDLNSRLEEINQNSKDRKYD